MVIENEIFRLISELDSQLTIYNQNNVDVSKLRNDYEFCKAAAADAFSKISEDVDEITRLHKRIQSLIVKNGDLENQLDKFRKENAELKIELLKANELFELRKEC